MNIIISKQGGDEPHPPQPPTTPNAPVEEPPDSPLTEPNAPVREPGPEEPKKWGTRSIRLKEVRFPRPGESESNQLWANRDPHRRR
jgi:hypothetical protein